MTEIQNFKIETKHTTKDGYISGVATGTFKGKRFYLPCTWTTELEADSDADADKFFYDMALAEITQMYNSEFGAVDYHYCPSCGFRMTDAEFMTITVEICCPGRGRAGCGTHMSRFHIKYIEGQ